MSKGKRNRERRRMERQQQESPVTEAEIFCVDCLLDVLKEAGVERDGPEWERQVERAKELLTHHRQEVRHMYKDGRKLLKEWFLAQMTMLDGLGVRE